MKLVLARPLLSFAVFVLMASGASAQAPSDKAPPELSDILKSTPASPDSSGIPTIRFNAIRETAVTYGARAGLARRTFENLKRLEKQGQSLDVIYNFQALMVEGNVVPPVLTETSDVYDQSSDEMLRVIGKVYRIEQQARFTYTTPNWRSYLLVGYDFDKDVVAAVTPQTGDERKLWEVGVKEGFALGVQQADDILKENFARLQRDFLGMVKYHEMLESGMVTKPYVGATKKGVTRAEDGSMHVGEVFLRITATPDFVSEPGKWKTGPKGLAADRLRSAADPEQGGRMLEEARAAGLVKDKGR